MRSKTSDPESLPVMESFYTIQGEGYHAGKPAYFIRLGGCDVGCHWCDVKESWDVSQFDWIPVESIIKNAEHSGATMVVVTGGEPLMYDLSLLTRCLRNAGLKASIKTSGAYPLSGEWDWVCFSPKKFKVAKKESYQKSNELKIIVYNKSDITWVQGHEKNAIRHKTLFTT